MRRRSVNLILFWNDPLGFVWRRVKAFVASTWCRFFGHSKRLEERFTGRLCSRCGIVVEPMPKNFVITGKGGQA